ncbi:MAG: PAS domain S-box protein [Persephonella sp.]|nr:PAS domain S-box protein [Persephonella sp.]
MLKRKIKMDNMSSKNVMFFYINDKQCIVHTLDSEKQLIDKLKNKKLCQILSKSQDYIKKCEEKINKAIAKRNKTAIITVENEEGKSFEVGLLRCKDHFLCYVVDITSQLDHHLFKTMSEVAPMGIFFHIKGKLLFANQKLAEILEMKINDIMKIDLEKLKEIIYPEDWPVVEKYLDCRLKNINRSGSYTIRIKTGSGYLKWIHINSETVPYMKEHAAVGTVEDITEKVILETVYRMLITINQVGFRYKYLNGFFHRITEILVDNKLFHAINIEEVIRKKKIPIITAGDNSLIIVFSRK